MLVRTMVLAKIKLFMLKLLSLTEIKIVWYWSKDGQMEQNSKSRNRTTYIQSPDVQESHILVN